MSNKDQPNFELISSELFELEAQQNFLNINNEGIKKPENSQNQKNKNLSKKKSLIGGQDVTHCQSINPINNDGLTFILKEQPRKQEFLSFCLVEEKINQTAKMCNEFYLLTNNINCFAFLPNKILRLLYHYFRDECDECSVFDLSKMTQQIWNKLSSKYLPAPHLNPPFEVMEKYPSFDRQPKITTVNLSNCLSQQKLLKLEENIGQQVKKAQNIILQKFIDLLKPIEMKNHSHFKYGLKVRNNEQKAIKRVIEKILKNRFQKMQLKNRPKENLFNFIEEERRFEQNEIFKVLNETKESLNTSVHDLVRGKFICSDLSQLLRSVDDVMQILKLKNCQIIIFKNRLNKQTSDIVINFLLEEMICEIQFSLGFPTLEYEYEFSHKLYEIKRRLKSLSILTALKVMNDDLGMELLKQPLEFYLKSISDEEKKKKFRQFYNEQQVWSKI